MLAADDAGTNLITVPEAARRANRDAETVRRWIRSGKLRARRIGTQYLIDESDLEMHLLEGVSLPVPEQWRYFDSGRPAPDWVAAIARSRRGH